jgi:uncharacterized protein (TIGR03118 family)
MTAGHRNRRTTLSVGTAIGLAVVLTAGPAIGASGHPVDQSNLVSDQPGQAVLVDSNLVNAWGMSQSPTSPVWVSNAETGVSTLYNGISTTTVTKVPLTVTIPEGAPTGQVFNPTPRFVVTDGTNSAPARFIFASEEGVISGWNPAVGTMGAPPPSTHAVPAAVDRGAVYKGLAMVATARNLSLYAANFRAGRVDVFDSSFHRVLLAGAFQDPEIPAAYAPFNVAALNGELFVSYALRDIAGKDDVPGPHRGFVDVYSNTGTLLRRLVRGGELNSPWGMVIAPASFGRLGGALLVGNFGDGRINAYDPMTGEPRGTLTDSGGEALEIEGLWGLLFGNGVSAPANALMFTAGPDDEEHGLFGVITASS